MKLSIIVLNYKNKNLVKYFLKNVLNFNFDFNWEILVVDNASNDGLNQLLKKEFPVVKFISSPKNIGMGAGNNLGIKQSKGDYLLIANPDITLNQESAQKLVDFLNQNPRVAIAAPKMINPDGTRQNTCYHWPKLLTFIYRRTWLGTTSAGKRHLQQFSYSSDELREPKQVDWVLGGCFLIRRKALDEVGLFDENFFLFLEDTDLCRRMWQKNWQVWYLPQAAIIHLPHRLSAGERTIKDAFSRLTWIHLISWLKYFWKWRSV